MNIIEKLHRKHQTWIEIVQSLGCNPETAKDIVSEMYLRLMEKIDKGLDIAFDDDVNYYYVYKTLKSLVFDLKRREKRIEIVNDDLLLNQPEDEFLDIHRVWDTIQFELSQMYWYDAKVFQIIDSGVSISELSRNSKIPYYSLYNTYRKVKKHLLSKL